MLLVTCDAALELWWGFPGTQEKTGGNHCKWGKGLHLRNLGADTKFNHLCTWYQQMLKDFPIRQSTAFSTGSSPVVALLFTAEAGLVLPMTRQMRACNIWVNIKGPKISGACPDVTDGTSN